MGNSRRLKRNLQHPSSQLPPLDGFGVSVSQDMTPFEAEPLLSSDETTLFKMVPILTEAFQGYRFFVVMDDGHSFVRFSELYPNVQLPEGHALLTVSPPLLPDDQQEMMALTDKLYDEGLMSHWWY